MRAERVRRAERAGRVDDGAGEDLVLAFTADP